MKLYRFRTYTTSYYFPKTTKETKFFYGLYSPFGGILSKIYWFLFKNISIVRCLSVVDTEEVSFPYKKIMDIEGTNSVLSFNMGSPGIEQKISILGWNKNEKLPFFAKYSQKPRAIELTKNEITVYKLLSATGLVPRLLKVEIGNEYAFIKTEYIRGKRPQSLDLTKEIMQLSLLLKDYHLTGIYTDRNGLKLALSHGDFCPWNMLEYEGKLKMIDWELAADRALGHDIFTYIVQTSLLLYPNKSLKKAINEYEDMIKEYFYLLDVENYRPYLHNFIRERIAYERSKGNHNRVLKLSEVIDHE